MSATCLILTYHAVERGPPPLCIEPALFAEHLDCIVESGGQALTVSELAAALRSGAPPERAVAVTFDDGFASVAGEAAELLLERGLRATVFCVAGRLGGENDWPTQRPDVPRRRLAGAGELAQLAAAGFEIGSHGVDHTPLRGVSEQVLRRELAESRKLLEAGVGAEVRSFAYPYGVRPPDAARRLSEAGYLAACATTIGLARRDSDRFALPRIDAHYVRRPRVLAGVLRGSLGGYLGMRRVGAQARRALRKDYRPRVVT